MISFVLGGALLAAGYLVWGRLTERSVAPDPQRPTPAVRLADGLDYVPMPTWRVYLVQLLNIAGLGPVFGAVMGALWGPQVLLWIVFGCIFGGAVHDFLAGAMSMRSDGAGLPDLIGRHLGRVARHASTGFILLLMVLVGTVFVKGPALLIAQLLPARTVGTWLGGGEAAAALMSPFAGHEVWLWVVMAAIFAYYLVATLLPIDAIIGRVYPFLAMALLVMVAGLALALLTGRIDAPTFTLANLHPRTLPAWPVIFITVSCGAVSGFHATQAPLMARCLQSESRMKAVFYGAMIAEGFIALIWASAAGGYYGGAAGLAAALDAGGPGGVVHQVCTGTMGLVGGILALLGVVVLPITSGDTAFRVGRLIVADYLRLPQARIGNRYLIAVPMFAVAAGLNFVNFSVVWRYFGWANQTLAAVALWTGAVYLARRRSRWWLAAAPATFMTVVTVTYILFEPFGFAQPRDLSTAVGVLAGAAAFGGFLWARPRLALDEEILPTSASEVEHAADHVAL